MFTLLLETALAITVVFNGRVAQVTGVKIL